jgi:hypothetical protein
MEKKNSLPSASQHTEALDEGLDDALSIMRAIADNHDQNNDKEAISVKSFDNDVREIKSPAAQNNSLISHGTAPPPPTNTGLRRNEYLQPAPGAVRVPGTAMTSDDATIAIGDDEPQPPASSPSLPPAPAGGALVADVQKPGQSRPALPTATPQDTAVVSARLVNKSETVKAEPMEEESPTSFWKDRRVVIIIFLLVLLAAGLGAGLVIGLNDTTESTTVQLVTSAPTSKAPTLSPTQSPSEFLEFDAPSADDCFDIASGLEVDGQETMNTTREFDLDLDITLFNPTDILSLLGEIRDYLQVELAPALAQCDFSRRYLRRINEKPDRRLILTKYVVGNAFFDIGELEDETCQAGAAANCHRIVERVVLDLKGGEETTSSLIGHILDVFDVGLNASEYPFDIELIGVTSSEEQY